MIDCLDPRALARFYCKVLGMRINEDIDGWVVIGSEPGLRQHVAEWVPPLWPDPDYPQQLAPTARTRLGKIWPPGAGTFARIIDERLALAPPSGAITPRRVGGGTGRPRENAHGAVLAQDGAALRPGLVGHGWGVPLAGACVGDG